nr:ribonuclease H-like domain-containing protein [Tanacetum cinerariifolium]
MVIQFYQLHQLVLVLKVLFLLKAKSTLMLAIPDEHLVKFHACKDAKSLWEAIKNSFGGNKESKKMRKTILKQNYKNFAASSQKELDKNYDSLPSAWNNITLIMRNKSDLDTLSMNDLYNNLKVYESDIKIQSSSRLNSQNVAFVSSANSSSTNGTVNTAHSVSAVSSKDQALLHHMFKKGERYHAVPPPYTENYMPPRADLSFVGLDISVFKFKVSETITSVPKIETNASKTSKDSLEKPKTVRPSAPLIEEWESDSEDKNVFKPKEVKKQLNLAWKILNLLMLGIQLLKVKTKLKNLGSLVRVLGELKFNHFSLSQMRDNKNSILFTDTKCVVLSPDFKLLDESQDLLKVPRNNNMYSFDLKNVVPVGDLTCLFAKATLDEFNLWHRRLGHINFKTMNKLVRGNLARGLPSKIFENDHTCVACQKGKQHKASYKTKTLSSISKPLQLLHMDLFGLVSIKSINKKTYCLVVTDDFSRFSWVLFLATKDETPEILKNFIVGIENQTGHKVKTIRCDNETEFKNRIMNGFCEMKGIRWEFSVARTPQQNGIFMRPFGYPVIILNTLDHLGQDGKKTVLGPQYVLLPLLTFDSQGPKSSENEIADDAGKKIIEVPRKKNEIQDPLKEGNNNDQEKDLRDQEEALRKQCEQEFIRLFGQGEAADTNSTNRLNTFNPGRESVQRNEFESMFGQDKDANSNKMFTYDANGNKMFTHVSANGSTYVNLGGSILVNAATLPNADFPTDPLMPNLEDTVDFQDTRIFSGKYDDKVKGAVVNFNNLELTIVISPIPITRIHKDHPKEKIIGDPLLAPQTKRMTKTSQEHAMMDVKSAFLYDTIEKEVYVCQHPGFEDSYLSNKVYKVEKALYGLHQAHRAWYETLYTYLLENRFRRGIIDKTLFIKKDKGDLLLVQVYVDDIIFGSTKKSLCIEFERLMHKKFQMSSMRELTFFLRLQVMQRDDGIFISQDKYVADILKKFDFSLVKIANTLIETNKALLKDEEAEDVDVYLYRLMIRSLMYLTAFRPDIMFTVCACARFQVTPKVSHLHTVKRFFRYLKGQPKLGLWYPKDSSFDLEAFLDSDYAEASPDKISITRALVDKKKAIVTDASIRRYLRFEDEGGVDSLSNEVIFEQLTLIGSTMPSAIICLATNKKFNFSKYIFDNMVKHLDGGVKFLMYLRFVQVFLDNQVEGMDRHNAIFVISSYTKKVFANIKREGKDFSGKVTPLFQSMMVQAPKDMGEGLEIPNDPHHTPIVTQPSSSLPQEKQQSRRKQRKKVEVPSPSSEIPNEEGVPITSNDPLPSEEAKTAQAKEIARLKKRVKKLEQKKKSRTLRIKRLKKVGSARRVESSTKASLGDQEDASKQGRLIDDIDQDVEITLVDDTQGRMNEEDMLRVNDLDGDEVVVDVSASKKVEQSVKVVENEVSTDDPVTTADEVVTTAGIEVTTAATTSQISKDELTLAQTLIEIKTAKSKAIIITATTVTVVGTRPKEKEIVMQEPSETPSPKPIISSQKPSHAKDKGKGKMVDPKRPLKR